MSRQSSASKSQQTKPKDITMQVKESQTIQINQIFSSSNKIVTRRMKKMIKNRKYEINERNEKVERCAICLGDQGNQSALLPCSHIFCIKCLNRWWIKHKTCPYCRASFEQFIDVDGNKRKMIDYQNESSDEQDENFITKCQVCWNEIQESQKMLICDKCRSIYVHRSCLGRVSDTKYYWLCDGCNNELQELQESSEDQQSKLTKDYTYHTSYFNNKMSTPRSYSLRRKRQ